jgi:hypothetical protein
MDRCDIPGMVSALPARAEPGQFKERPVRAWANGFETLHPPEVVEGRESKVEKGDTAKMCATTCTAPPRGRNQNEILRVLRASKASTQRARRISVTSVLSFHLATENTEALLAREEIFAAQQRPRN